MNFNESLGLKVLRDRTIFPRQGSEEIEVSNGRTLDAEMKAWRMSYEVPWALG